MNTHSMTYLDEMPVVFVTDDDREVSPFMLGVLDAERNALCIPEIYYIRRGDMLEYAEGFESVAGPTLLSSQLLGKTFVSEE